ncbi:MAG: KGG domain-containing protein [bacterium]|nr:KGG domain-containing protein [bacterium]
MANDDTKKKQNNTNNSDDKRSQNNGQGFASMPTDEVREIASDGGKAAHKSGNAFEFEKGSKLASEAGRKGGQNSHSGGRQSDDE